MVKIEFKEQTSPTLIQTSSKKQKEPAQKMDLFSKGYAWVGAETGAVYETYFLVGALTDGIPEAGITVEYGMDEALGILVPLQMREKYSPPKRISMDKVDSWATYSNFRQFSVDVEQKMNPVQQPQPSRDPYGQAPGIHAQIAHPGSGKTGQDPAMQREDGEIETAYHQHHSELPVPGTPRIFSAIIESMKSFPGRKIIAFVPECFPFKSEMADMDRS